VVMSQTCSPAINSIRSRSRSSCPSASLGNYRTAAPLHLQQQKQQLWPRKSHQ
jgi:hypothetical protein